jgi:NAD dependent epimerase/dehydratase family enzyme
MLYVARDGDGRICDLHPMPLGDAKEALPADNAEVLQFEILAKMGKKIWLPAVPAWVLKLALGEMSELALKGSRVSAVKIQAAGFSFQFETLKEALNDLLG